MNDKLCPQATRKYFGRSERAAAGNHWMFPAFTTSAGIFLNKSCFHWFVVFQWLMCLPRTFPFPCLSIRYAQVVVTIWPYPNTWSLIHQKLYFISTMNIFNEYDTTSQQINLSWPATSDSHFIVKNIALFEEEYLVVTTILFVTEV